jgi:hypothetical protein
VLSAPLHRRRGEALRAAGAAPFPGAARPGVRGAARQQGWIPTSRDLRSRRTARAPRTGAAPRAIGAAAGALACGRAGGGGRRRSCAARGARSASFLPRLKRVSCDACKGASRRRCAARPRGLPPGQGAACTQNALRAGGRPSRGARRRANVGISKGAGTHVKSLEGVGGAKGRSCSRHPYIAVAARHRPPPARRPCRARRGPACEAPRASRGGFQPAGI